MVLVCKLYLNTVKKKKKKKRPQKRERVKEEEEESEREGKRQPCKTKCEEGLGGRENVSLTVSPVE